MAGYDSGIRILLAFSWNLQGNGNPLWYSWMKNLVDRGLVAYSARMQKSFAERGVSTSKMAL